ncbi:MAG: aminotransferase class V-fold PLP-dependent enzyme [Myxococcota bacterium]|nr:aminotransferase class V-fold PLP-dependent enzyme [Myxococcota bacterium]
MNEKEIRNTKARMPDTVDPDQIRRWFPALKSTEVFLDNAGGSQLPISVIDQIREYYANTYVQLGADYPTGRRATHTVEQAREVQKILMNAGETGQIILGPSTSALCAMLADCYARALDPNRNEVIVCEAGHEANVGPWVRLADRGYVVKTWRLDPNTFTNPLDELEILLSAKTRVLAVPHVSNLLGAIEDISVLAQMAHQVGARIVVDGVAYAPHRAMDVAGWDVDYYVYSSYKVYGPHMAVMFGTHQALAALEGPNHFFIHQEEVPHKFELGGVLHEGCAGILGLPPYLGFLAGSDEETRFDRSVVERAFEVMTRCELPLQGKLIEYLQGKDQVRLIGPGDTGRSRVGTISFVHRRKSSKEIVLAANAQGVGIRYGHFYAHRLATALGLDPEDGVVRASLLHYNTEAEIDRLINCLDQLL